MNAFLVVLYIIVGTFAIYILSLEKRLKAFKAEVFTLKKYVETQRLQLAYLERELIDLKVQLDYRESELKVLKLQLEYREMELKVQKENLRKENKVTLRRAKPVEINYLINSLSVPSSDSELYTFLDYAERLLDTYDKTGP